MPERSACSPRATLIMSPTTCPRSSAARRVPSNSSPPTTPPPSREAQATAAAVTARRYAPTERLGTGPASASCSFVQQGGARRSLTEQDDLRRHCRLVTGHWHGEIFGDMRSRLPRDRSDAVKQRYRRRPRLPPAELPFGSGPDQWRSSDARRGQDDVAARTLRAFLDDRDSPGRPSEPGCQPQGGPLAVQQESPPRRTGVPSRVSL